MITCFIRYEIDPFKTAQFEHYARNWGAAIPRCGAELIGYFAPHEGSATTAYGVYTIESLSTPGKLLSLSIFRDEAAVAAWRNRPGHRATQAKGRNGVFADYRLRVAQVLRDYGLEEREEAPADSRTAHG